MHPCKLPTGTSMRFRHPHKMPAVHVCLLDLGVTLRCLVPWHHDLRIEFSISATSYAEWKVSLGCKSSTTKRPVDHASIARHNTTVAGVRSICHPSMYVSTCVTVIWNASVSCTQPRLHAIDWPHWHITQ